MGSSGLRLFTSGAMRPGIVTGIVAGIVTGFLALCWAPGAFAADAEVTDIRVGKHGLSTRIVVDLDRPVEAKVFTLAGPARLVIDLPEVGWRLPPRPLPSNTGLLSKLRYGLFQPGNSRIVVDLSEPSRVHEAISLPGAAGQPDRLVIDLARATGKAFLQSVAAPPMLVRGSETQIVSAQPQVPPQAAPEPSRSVPEVVAKAVTVPEKPQPPAAAPPAPQAPVFAAANSAGADARLASLRVPTKPPVPGFQEKRIIVIDPGHGGVDPGAISVSGIYEKHITLAAARDLKAHLESTGRFKVMLTRDPDNFIRLRGRIERAREMKADLFISLHADTIRNHGVRGLSLYTLSERASDKEAAELAERENKADLIAGIDLTHESAEVTNILIDLAQRETMNQSAKLAALLVDELQDRVKVLQNPHRFGGFAVLKAPDIPSVLIELGFLSNKDDERALRSKTHRRKLAQSIAGAVDRYFTKIESASRP
jgi:N-acetylmuramoyl-L-alanine amidase